MSSAEQLPASSVSGPALTPLDNSLTVPPQSDLTIDLAPIDDETLVGALSPLEVVARSAMIPLSYEPVLTVPTDDSTAQETKKETQTADKARADGPKSGQDASNKTRKAACACGQLRVTVKGPDPERIGLCHCNLFQKQSGSAFAIQARCPREQVTIEGKSTA